MTINEAIRSGARDRMVTGDDIAHTLAAGAEYYPAATWPKTQPLRGSVWRQLASELNLGVQYGGVFREGQKGYTITAPDPAPGGAPIEIAGSTPGAFPISPAPAWYPTISTGNRNNIYYSP